MPGISEKQNRAKKPKSPESWKSAELRLRAEREKLLSGLAADSTSVDELFDGWQERGSASEDEIRDLEYMHRGAIRQRIHQIDHALKRIKAGTYGRCDRCGESINRLRLANEPVVALCLTCQKSIEGEIVPSTM